MKYLVGSLGEKLFIFQGISASVTFLFGQIAGGRMALKKHPPLKYYQHESL
jgi:hypothetical protein